MGNSLIYWTAKYRKGKKKNQTIRKQREKAVRHLQSFISTYWQVINSITLSGKNDIALQLL